MPHPNHHINLYKAGDFYEAYNTDAISMAKILRITLSERKGREMAGIPAHDLSHYIDRLNAVGTSVTIRKV